MRAVPASGIPAGRGGVGRRPALEADVVALGYQGRSLSEFIGLVRTFGIEQVLDVRERAVSRKPGFSAPDLTEALARVGAVYVHLPELGCTGRSRRALWHGGSPTSFLEDYRRQLEGRPDALADLLRRVRSARCLLLCQERDPARCHRAALLERLRTEGIAVQDL